MYQDFYKLTALPFQLSPDPHFFFSSSGHKRALSYLRFGVNKGEGFIVITGHVGTGKTTLAAALFKELEGNNILTANVVTSQLGGDDILRMVAASFGLKHEGLSKASLMTNIETFFHICKQQKKRALLVIDEAQNLPKESLEELRMLSNFQDGQKALLQTFLLGQAEFRDTIALPELEQLRQRVIASYHLHPMSSQETEGYIKHRLQTAGWQGDPGFTGGAFTRIYQQTRGVPRLINSLCDRLLLFGSIEEIHLIDEKVLQIVIEELEGEVSFSVAPNVDYVDAPEFVSSSSDLRDDSESNVASDQVVAQRFAPQAEVARYEPPTYIKKYNSVGKKILCVIGSRANVAKISPIIKALSAGDEPLEPLLVHTGLQYDEILSGPFFEQLGVPSPQFDLGVGESSQSEQTAEIMRRFEPLLIEQEPAAVLLVGDVNATLACALVAAKRQIPVVHVEAGLRSYDRNMPEEINRVLTDQVSDLLFVTESDAQVNLRKEGVGTERVRFVGNVMIDTLKDNLERAIPIEQTLSRMGLDDQEAIVSGEFALLTLHRDSNIDDPEVLERLLRTFRALSKQVPIIFPRHPRTEKVIEEAGLEYLLDCEGIFSTGPFSYLEMLSFIKKAKFVMTDSGCIQEETTALGVPCLTLRENTERPITVTLGTNTVVGSEASKIVETVKDIIATGGKRGNIPELWDGQSAMRINDELKLWLTQVQ